MLEVVDALDAAAAAQEEAMEAGRREQKSALARLQALEEDQLHLEEKYSSTQVKTFFVGLRFKG